MTYKQIEDYLNSKNFTHVSGANPLKGMTFKNEHQIAIVFVVREQGSIKHKVEYYDIISQD